MMTETSHRSAMNISPDFLDVLGIFDVYEKAQGQAVLHLLLGMFIGAVLLLMAACLCQRRRPSAFAGPWSAQPPGHTPQGPASSPDFKTCRLQRKAISEGSLSTFIARRSEVYHTNSTCTSLTNSADIKQYNLCFHCAGAGLVRQGHGVRLDFSRSGPVNEHAD